MNQDNQYLRVYGYNFDKKNSKKWSLAKFSPDYLGKKYACFVLGVLLSNVNHWITFYRYNFESIYGLYQGFMAYDDIIDRDDTIPEEVSPHVKLTVILALNENFEIVNIIDKIMIPFGIDAEKIIQDHKQTIVDLSPSPDSNTPVLNLEH